MPNNYSLYFFKNLYRSLSEDRQYYDQLANQADKIIVWLIGLSIGSIGLIVSSKLDLNLITSKLNSGVLIFSSLVIIFGILYRIITYKYQIAEIELISIIRAKISSLENPFISNESDAIRKIEEEKIKSFLIENLGESKKSAEKYFEVQKSTFWDSPKKYRIYLFLSKLFFFLTTVSCLLEYVWVLYKVLKPQP